MSNMILLGGIENSGKSALAKELAKNDKYVHINPDIIFEHLRNNPGDFFIQVEKKDPEFFKIIEEIASSTLCFNPNDIAGNVQDYLRSKGHNGLYTKIVETVSKSMTLENLKKVKANKIPIYDTLLLTKDNRNATYSRLTSLLKKSSISYIGPVINKLKKPFDFDEANKLFIHFNPGLDVCIKRLENTQETQSYVVEENIRDSFKKQEIPRERELPNTKIIVIDKVYPVNELVKMVQKEIQK